MSKKAAVLPTALEDNFPPEGGRFYRAAAKVDFQNSQDKLIVSILDMFVLSSLTDPSNCAGWSLIPATFCQHTSHYRSYRAF